MSAGLVALLVSYALGMAVGQVLFKIAAERAKHHDSNAFLGAVLLDGYFVTAVVTYFALTLLWVAVLTRVPLSRAYPFVVLSFVFTPLLAAVLLGEQLSLWYFLGVALILTGLMVLLLKAS